MNTYPIEPLKNIRMPRAMIFFDTESFIHQPQSRKRKGKNTKEHESERHTLRLGVAIFHKIDTKGNIQERYAFKFKTAGEFWNFVKVHASREKTLYVYAHNIKYDLANVDVIQHLKVMMKDEGWDIPYPVISHNFIMTAQKEPRTPRRRMDGKQGKVQYKQHIYFLDTFNYAKESLANIGKKLGLPKLEIDLQTEDENELYRYCHNDVEIAEKFILSFIQTLRRDSLGNLKFTLAATAFDIWRHSFMDETVYYHTNKEVLKVEREAYRGGRVECFVIGTPKPHKDNHYAFYLDVNSMYPYVMANKRLPVRPFMIEGRVGMNTFKAIMERCYVIADVRLQDTDLFTPYGLKFNGDINGQNIQSLIFPRGEYRITLHHSELEHAFRKNAVKEIYAFICYDSGIVLKSYVDYFYNMKKTATNPVDYEIAKILMNSLYGRFALRQYDNEIVNLTSEMDFFEEIDEPYNFAGSWDLEINGKIRTYYHWMETLVHSYADEFIPVKNTSVALAGAVTAEARLLLYRYATLAGAGNVYYCDTDSLMVNAEGYRNLSAHIHESELGKLKLEAIADLDEFIILAPKNYKFGKKERSKGIPKGAEVTEDGKYIFWRFTTFKDYLRDGADFRGRVQVIKQNRLDYHKAIVDKETGLVTPFNMRYINGENRVILS